MEAAGAGDHECRCGPGLPADGHRTTWIRSRGIGQTAVFDAHVPGISQRCRSRRTALFGRRASGGECAGRQQSLDRLGVPWSPDAVAGERRTTRCSQCESGNLPRFVRRSDAGNPVALPASPAGRRSRRRLRRWCHAGGMSDVSRAARYLRRRDDGTQEDS